MKSEGGEVEEIVREENGILISAMLRQYFTALRTVGKWKKLSSYWTRLANKCASPVSSPVAAAARLASPERRRSSLAARPATAESPGPGPAPLAGTPRTWEDWLQRRKGLDEDPGSDEEDDEDEIIADVSEGRLDGGAVAEDSLTRMDWEVLLMRKFFGFWASKAGVRREVCDPDQEEADRVDWTRVVAPVVEGRIKMVVAAAA